MHPGDYLVCADEKPSIQARRRKHATLPATRHPRGQRVEHEYERGGALCYLAAWDAGAPGSSTAAPRRTASRHSTLWSISS